MFTGSIITLVTTRDLVGTADWSAADVHANNQTIDKLSDIAASITKRLMGKR